MRAMASSSGSAEHFHVKGIGVEQASRVQHHAHMAFPENQIAAPDLVAADGMAQRLFHHVGVAGRRHAGGLQRGLDQAGTIQPRRRLAAPDIRHAQKALGHRDKIAARVDPAAPDARGMNKAARRCARNRPGALPRLTTAFIGSRSRTGVFTSARGKQRRQAQ